MPQPLHSTILESMYFGRLREAKVDVLSRPASIVASTITRASSPPQGRQAGGIKSSLIRSSRSSVQSDDNPFESAPCERHGDLGVQAVSVLYGDPSSSVSPPFFVISAPSFVPSSGASHTSSWSLYAANSARNSCWQGPRPRRAPPGREGLTEYKLRLPSQRLQRGRLLGNAPKWFLRLRSTLFEQQSCLQITNFQREHELRRLTALFTRLCIRWYTVALSK
jgi:hypothetical protein